MNKTQAERLTAHSSWFRYWMPYVFQHIEGNTYLPLNRDYKPLGVISRDHVDYDEYVQTHGVVLHGNPKTFEGIWHDSEDLSLYNDNPESRTDYFARLDKLMQRSAKTANRSAVTGMNRIWD